ncbi:hypothetical protein [Iodobacter fluviatilis]|uniref:Entry exclusion protein n=1 Tax=Iodobacter fluviatilis TaxID=537 RepID=A0A7G3GEY2_9NEIS|nr:hypothetical protein [Iodobacter fluviatilis]QBC42100.1 hypothetical protein C1H71_00020 [Iodobacter fluviatilis]QBC45572.1 hypothetical protein C1H71_19955 [Iodobacter fluviatilis]
MKYIFVFIALAGATVGHAQNSSRDVNYWLKPEHKEELNKTIEKYSNDPARYASNPDCINAKEAKKKLFKNKFISN